MVQEDLERRGELWQWGWPLEVDNDNWEPSLKLDPLQLHEKLPKKSTAAILQSFGTWSKLEKWKSDKWVTHELTVNQKKKKTNTSFWSIFVSCSRQQQWTISWSDCDMQWKVGFIQQLTMTSSVVGLRRTSKALPKVKFVLIKGHHHCLVVYCLFDPLQLSESQWNHYIWDACSANQRNALKTAKPTPDIDQQKGPNSSAWQRPTHACNRF